ncbi:MAG: GMC oxidoreductase, partial [Pseudomonadota bacterium]
MSGAEGANLSRDFDEIGEDYEVVVVGSGYGGGIAASRMARAGRKVAVLERGREFRPGEYPDKTADIKDSIQIDTPGGRIGNPAGLFNLHANPDMYAMVGCGLGGTSLINANVALEIDKRLFETEVWPNVFRDDPDLLAPYYQRARDMLDVEPYPDDWPELNKLKALERSATAMGKRFYRPPIAVNFEDRTNPFGVPQPKCTNCGDCCSGCNIGAKNTVLMNYLPDAHGYGAEIFTDARVEWLERDGERWRLHIASHAGTGTPRTVLADVVMLGAGALGSTEILLRSAAKGLPLSSRLGRRFSGNGDVLAFGFNSYWTSSEGTDAKGIVIESADVPDLNGVGVGANPDDAHPFPGPCITGIIDIRDEARPEDGLVIEEGVIPSIMAAALPPAFFFADALAGSFTRFGIKEAKPRLNDAKDLGEAFQKDPGALADWSYKGPVARTQTYLVMSDDNAGGTLKLENDRLLIDWPGAGRTDVMARDNEMIRKASDAVRGQFFPSPLWRDEVGNKTITVHPVGGCGMADDAAAGVVNDRCQVFFGQTGADVHEGLYVCDGAVMPGAVGVNPYLTISAVAERACELLAKDKGWTVDYDIGPSTALPPAAVAAASTPTADAEPAPVRKGLLSRIEASLAHHAEALAADIFGGLLKHIEALAKALEDDAIDLAKDLLAKIIHDHPDLLSPQFGFTETMHGWISTRPVHNAAPAAQRITDDYRAAEAWGRDAGTPLDFRLTIHTDDLNAMVTERQHRAAITGVVHCATLSPTPMAVKSGEFQLLIVDEDDAEAWRMTYDMVLMRDGRPVRFRGHKILKERAGSTLWGDVTTLFVTVHDGEAGDGELLAQGVLTLNLDDLMHQAQSITLDVKDDWIGHLIERFPRVRTAIGMVYLGKFAGFFGMTLFRAYGGLLADLNNFPRQDLALETEPRRELRLPDPDVETLTLSDGFKVRFTRYTGGDKDKAKGPVIVAPGFSVLASSYAIDTVETNFAEALVAAGYDVWLFDYRASDASGNLEKDADGIPLKDPKPYTIDDIALIDWPEAIAHVRGQTGRDVQIVAHCIASMSLLMSLAAG